MKNKIIFYILSWVLKIEALLLLFPIYTAYYYKENTLNVFLLVFFITLILGLLLGITKPRYGRYYARESFIIVALSWIILSIIGALPFYLSKEISLFHDALFETISGFTTTGASILDNVELMSRSMLLWRSFTHWTGGMGVIVFMLIVLPMSSGSNMLLMKGESPGPSVSKLVPRLRDTAFITYAIYFAMTLIEIVLLILSGMPLFDSVCISLGSAGTGGFGIRMDSCASYNILSQIIITIFMFLFGVNFTFYYLIITKKIKQAFKMEEVKFYFLIFTISALLITFNIRNMFDNFFVALQQAFFQVSTIMTTTGFSTCNFDLWPEFSKVILVLLMFIGACAGSTGGGIKVSRIIILVKQTFFELRNYIHPRDVKVVTLNNKRVDTQTIKQVLVYFATYVLVFVVSLLIISIDNFDFTTNFTAVAATFNNIGPGLNKVGPMVNYNSYSVLSKYVLMFCMLAGRLELYPMLLFFLPYTWKNK